MRETGPATLATARALLADAASDADNVARADMICAGLLEDDALSSDAWMLRAIIRAMRKQPPEPFFRRAMICAPAAWRACFNRCRTLGENDKPVALRRARCLAPAQPTILDALAAVAYEEDRGSVEAEELDKRTLLLAPDCASPWERRASRAAKSGRPDRALEILARLNTLPGNHEIAWQRISACLPPGFDDLESRDRTVAALSSAIDALEDAPPLARPEVTISAVRLFFLAYAGVDDTELMRRFGSATARQVAARPAGRMPGRNDAQASPLAIICGCTGKHSVWKAIGRWWSEALAEAGIPCDLYDLNGFAEATDRALFARVLSGPMPVSAWIERIRAGKHKVILFPEIGLDPLGLYLANHRFAPIQVNSWGHPTTSGLPHIDYYLGADFMDPPGAERQYTERLIRLPGPGAEIGRNTLPPRPPRRSVRPTAILCQSLFKFLPDFDPVLLRIAREVPDCRIIIIRAADETTSDRFAARLSGLFDTGGVYPADILEFRDRAEPEQFVEILQSADLYLDSPSFSGFNTALIALRAGLPVLTTDASRLRARLAVGILEAIGLAGELAPPPEAFSERAVTLLKNPGEAFRLGSEAQRRLANHTAAPQLRKAFLDQVRSWLDRAWRAP
ncbi:hypothetical protein [Nisaea sp.]|uniref:hypothetical protein n=1 Tax=Nisaea sp. TaxID=2024842 RepID=UPI003B528203